MVLQTVCLIVFNHRCRAVPLTLQVFLFYLAWPGITSGMLISAASVGTAALSETSLNYILVLGASSLVRTSVTMGCSSRSRPFFNRAFKIMAIYC